MNWENFWITIIFFAAASAVTGAIIAFVTVAASAHPGIWQLYLGTILTVAVAVGVLSE